MLPITHREMMISVNFSRRAFYRFAPRNVASCHPLPVRLVGGAGAYVLCLWALQKDMGDKPLSADAVKEQCWKVRVARRLLGLPQSNSLRAHRKAGCSVDDDDAPALAPGREGSADAS